MSIHYRLKKSRRARRMWLSVHCDGSVVVTIPDGTHAFAAWQFVQQKKDWLIRTIVRVAKYKDDIVLPTGRRDYLARKEEARRLVHSLIERLNTRYGFKFGRIFIKNLKRNWGSCSESANLNFNYKIVFLPERLAEYLVVHELCHLGAFDHSPAFWELVSQIVPDHKERRKELRRYHL